MKVSIITVTYNSEPYLEETIKSVLSQNYENIEYIIVDGISTDNTLEIINKYRAYIDNVIVEKDKSMYDAINKGLKISTGDIIAILNSDDMIADNNVISKIVDVMSDVNISGCYSNVINLYDNKKINKRVFNIGFNDYLISGKGTFIPHTSLYLKRSVFEKVGLYNLDYKYAADYDFIIRVLNKYKLKHIDEYLFLFRRHSGSITASGKIKEERELINKFYLRNFNYYYRIKRFFLWFKYYIKNISYKNLISYLR